MAENKEEGNWFKLDPVAIGLLQAIVKKSEAKVVLSSTWRLGATKEELENLSNYLGVDIIGVTRNTRSHPNKITEPRGWQIQDWLNSYSDKVTHYVIIDDDDDMLAGQQDNFVKVDGQNGFSFENYLSCLTILDADN